MVQPSARRARALDPLTPPLPSTADDAPGRLAIVVFVDRCDGPWLRMLRRGFRHCFVVLRQDAGDWLICDPLKDRIDAQVVQARHDLALAEAYLAAGHRVCLGWTRIGARPVRPPLPEVLTCVAIVKRLIGLRCRHVITPFQLHRHLVSSPETSWLDLGHRNLSLTFG